MYISAYVRACGCAYVCIFFYIHTYTHMNACACVCVYTSLQCYTHLSCISVNALRYTSPSTEKFDHFSPFFFHIYRNAPRMHFCVSLDVFPVLALCVDTALRTFNSFLTIGRLGVSIFRTRNIHNSHFGERIKRKKKK